MHVFANFLVIIIIIIIICITSMCSVISAVVDKKTHLHKKTQHHLVTTP